MNNTKNLAATAGTALVLTVAFTLADTPALMQQKLLQWIDVKKSLSAESADWIEEKQQLSTLNTIRRREIEQLDELLAHTETTRQQSKEKEKKLNENLRRLETKHKKLQLKIDLLQKQIQPLIANLPQPLHDKLAPEISRTENPDPETPLQNRYRDLLFMLSEISDFNNTITVSTKLHESAHKKIHVDVIYLGLAQAWYVDRSGRYSGSGIPSADGWHWIEDTAFADNIRNTIDIANKQAAPAFTTLQLQPKGDAQ